jgi:ABC-type multidrug transport system fused ATPase/permease subunit
MRGSAILFDAAFNYLRRTLVVYASARIDVRTSTRTFELLLSLSIDFFERVSAGVITKHTQQVKKIREFLTGRLLLTLLDATSLLVVVPLLFMYSRVLAMLVLGFSAFQQRGRKSGFADAGLARKQHHLAFTALCPRPAPQQKFALLFSPDERGPAARMQRLEAARHGTRPQRRPGPCRTGNALEILAPRS